MLGVEHDQMIGTFASYRPDQPLHTTHSGQNSWQMSDTCVEDPRDETNSARRSACINHRFTMRAMVGPNVMIGLDLLRISASLDHHSLNCVQVKQDKN